MPIDTTPSTVATNALQALPFDSLIGGPLDAAINAQAIAAKTSWEFIEKVGLDEDGEAKNVTFVYNKNGQMTNLIVPLLTIVPIPYIAIDEMKIDFMANISASSSSVTTESDASESKGGLDGKAGLKVGPFGVSAKFNANYSSKKSSRASQESKYSVEYTMNVSVHAGQSDMPAGLATVLNILQSSITDASADGSFVFAPVNPVIDMNNYMQGDTFAISAVIKDGNGLFVKNQKVTLTTDIPLTGSNEATTDNVGKVGFVLSPEQDLASGGYELKFEVLDDTALSATMLVDVIGAKPAPPVTESLTIAPDPLELSKADFEGGGDVKIGVTLTTSNGKLPKDTKINVKTATATDLGLKGVDFTVNNKGEIDLIFNKSTDRASASLTVGKTYNLEVSDAGNPKLKGTLVVKIIA